MEFNYIFRSYRTLFLIFILATPFLFFIGGPEQYSPRSLKHAWNLGHIIYHALLPIVFVKLIKSDRLSPFRQILIALGLAIVVGTTMEIFQSFLGRHFDYYDLVRNSIGAIVAISFLLPVRHIIPPIFKLLTFVVVLSQLYPLATSLIDEYQSRRDFPILADFQSPFQIHRWQSNSEMTVAEDIITPGNRALKVLLPTTQHPGVEMNYFPSDWRLFKVFQLRIFNATLNPLPVICRIHDERHAQGLKHYDDRFNKEFILKPAWNTINISLYEIHQAPKGRIMDLSKIRGIVIFTTQPLKPLTIYIDDLKLL